jgi:hypothetical protein
MFMFRAVTIFSCMGIFLPMKPATYAKSHIWPKAGVSAFACLAAAIWSHAAA